MARKFIVWFKQDAHMTDDRQTDYTMQNCVAIAGIACTAKHDSI